MIRRFVSESLASNGLVVAFSCILLFHVTALVGLIPADMLWGGRITSQQEFFVFEGISILLNLGMLLFTAASTGKFRWQPTQRVSRVAFGLMFLLFLANTVGNLFAISAWERIIFTPVTAILAVFSLRLAARK